jgi:hypothetical protein
MGAGFDRVVAALDAHGRQPRVYGSGQANAHCPGPGHYRDDQHPSLKIGHGKGGALVYCHALCHTDDVLAAIGLTAADLFDEPRTRPDHPDRNQLHAAIGKARGFSPADRWVYGWLLWPMNWDGSGVPLRFQPRSQRELADACGLDLASVKQSITHLVHHGWLAISCGQPDCKREAPHAGRGHRSVYEFPGIGADCPGESCRSRCRTKKGATRAHLRVVNAASAITLIAILGSAGSAASPTTTYLQQKPAVDLRVSASSAPISLCRLHLFTEE